MPVDYQIFNLAGTYFDLGRAQGARTERFGIPAWWLAPAPMSFARDCARQIGEIHPPPLDDVWGCADSQDFPCDDVLRGVCRQSMSVRALPAPRRDAPGKPDGGWSSFAVVGADRHVRVGRNYDVHPVQQATGQLLRLKPTGGRPTLGMRGAVPGGHHDGVNDAGLFIRLHVALSDEPTQVRTGLPFHVVPRLVLETCAGTRQAMDLLRRVRHLHPFNYLVVAAHPQAVRVTEAGTDFAAATNHFRYLDVARRQLGRQLKHSQHRLERLCAQRDRLSASGEVAAALADHDSRVCGHAGGHTTSWSLSVDLTARTILYARGAPCQTNYEAVVWPG